MVLVLTRKVGEKIVIGDNITVMVISVDRENVRLGIEAPRDIDVNRLEIFEQLRRNNQNSAASSPIAKKG
jgi:carbon storage regulator